MRWKFCAFLVACAVGQANTAEDEWMPGQALAARPTGRDIRPSVGDVEVRPEPALRLPDPAESIDAAPGDGRIRSCLAANECDLEQQACSPGTDWPRECLVTPIPAWSGNASTAGRVHCCFKCCLRHWQRRLGLDTNSEHWEKHPWGGQTARLNAGHEQVFGLASDEVVLGTTFIARFAHFVLTAERFWDRYYPDVAAPDGDSDGPASHRFHASDDDPLELLAVPRPPERSGPGNGSIIFLQTEMSRTKAWHERLAAALPEPRIIIAGGDNMIGPADVTDAALLGPWARWFVRNMDADAPDGERLTPFPIGVKQPGAWRSEKKVAKPGDPPPAADPKDRRRRRNKRKEAARTYLDGREARVDHRETLFLCCCMRQFKWRSDAMATLGENGLKCDPATRLEAEQHANGMLDAKFVFSPRGNGHSNYREYEALLAGAVPVVDHWAPHAEMLRGLPVVSVADWAKVTPEALEEAWEGLLEMAAAGTVRREKTFFPYWFAQVTAPLPVVAD